MRKICTIKIMTLVIVIFLIVTSFSSVATSLSNDKTEYVVNSFEDETVFSDDENNMNHVSVKYLFERPDVKKVSIGDIIYDQILMPKVSCAGNPGEPSLPVKGAYILLPEGTKVIDITVTSSEQLSLRSDIIVEPVGESVPISQVSSAPIPRPDETIYKSNCLFPGNLFTHVGAYDFRGYSILVLALHPVQYIPASGELFYYSEITICVKTVEDKNVSLLFRGLETDSFEVMSKVDNPSVVDTYRSHEKSQGSRDEYDLLIITTDDLKEGFNSLKDAHDAEGLNTLIYTVEDIYSAYPDGGNPEKIRNFIRDVYNDSGIEYVLIGGDDDVVPSKVLWVESGQEDTTYVPSDLYYACLDGPFNYDGDEYWGEPNDGENADDVDLIAEVYVGRACVDNTTEVGYFVNKTLTYMDTDPDDEYLNTVLMVGEWLGFGGVGNYGGSYMDELINGSSNHGYTTVGIPSDNFTIDRLYDRDWPGFDPGNPWITGWPKEEIVGRINNGTHIINHMGHAGGSMNMRIYNADTLAFMNDQYCFIYSQGCSSGAFDNPGVPDRDCIAEYFTVKAEHGAFAGIWNAREGWGAYYSTNAPSQRFNREFWDAIFNENALTFSKANQDSKEDNLYCINNDYMRWCYYELNLFGDPALAFKTKDEFPPTLEITKPGQSLYINNNKVIEFIIMPVIFGNIDIEINASDTESGVNRVEFYIDDELKYTDDSPPYSWTWDEKTPLRFRHTLRVTAYDNAAQPSNETINVWKFL